MAKLDSVFNAEDHPYGDELYKVLAKEFLDDAADKISRTRGNRRNAINGRAFEVGKRVGAGHLDRGEAFKRLRDAGIATGKTAREVEDIVNGALDDGSRQPITMGPKSLTESDSPARYDHTAQPSSKPQTDNRYATRLFLDSVPATGTIVETYLRGRGIACAMPQEVRFHPAVEVAAGTFPAMLMTSGRGGTVHRVQAVFLTKDGTRALDAEGKKRKKQTFGRGADHIPAVLRGDDIIVEVEGPEDGLSIWSATGHTVAITFGAVNFGKAIYPAGSTIILAGDADTAGRIAVERAVGIYGAAGHDVRIAYPPEPYKDFNELLQAVGQEAVKLALTMQVDTRATAAVVDLPPTVTADEARAMVEAVIGASIDGAVRYWEAMRDFARDALLLEQGFPLDPPVTSKTDLRGHWEPIPEVTALRSDTGVGKSSIFRQLAPKLLAAAPGRKIVVAVPRVDLAREAAREARTLGLRAMAFAGRDRVVEGADPDDPKPETMCVDPDALKDAVDATVGIQKSICLRKVEGVELKCASVGICQYQLQRIVAENSDIIFLAHEYLFHEKPEFINELSMLVIDESFYDVGISRGASLTLASLKKDRLIWHSNKDLRGKVDFNRSANHSAYQSMLVQALEGNGNGYLQRASLKGAGITADIAHDAKALAWALWEDPGIYPGMDAADRRKRAATVYDTNKFAVKLAAVWNCIIQMYAAGYPASGHLVFGVVDSDKDDGDIIGLSIKYRKDIHPGWKSPTLILDATLRPELVLPYFPWIKLVDTPAVSMPHATVALIEGAPTTEHKAIAGKSAREKDKVTARNHQIDLHRFLRLRSAGRRKVLMVAQQALEAKLLALGLPSRFDSAHHNAVAGLDCWKSVDQLYVLGRTAPGPQGVEMVTAALTGYPVALTADGKWYGRVTGAITIRDGREHRMDIDQHSHPVAEAVRWVITEGQLVQVIGRARGVNRTAENPVEILIMSDVVLPVIVDRIESWKAPEREAEMILCGAWLENSSDMAAAYPDVWATADAAKKDRQRTGTNAYSDISLKAFVPVLVRYQPVGVGQKPRDARFDPEQVANPKEWLEARLGPLARFEIIEAPIRTSIVVVLDTKVWITDDGRRWFREPTATATAKGKAMIHDQVEPSAMAVGEMLRPVNVGHAVATGLVVGRRELPEIVIASGWVGWKPGMRAVG